MRYSLLITLILIVLLSVIGGTVVWAARQQPLPDRVAMLHFDQCAPPCWIGIVPGKTTRAEAIDSFTALYSSIHDYTIHTIQAGYFEISYVSDPARKYRVSFTPDNKGIVKSIDFELFDELTLADFSILLGTPRYFILQHIGDGGDAIMYGEKDYGVMLFLMPYRRISSSVTWEIRLRNISLFGKGGHFRANSHYVFLPWQSWRNYESSSAQR